MIKSWLGHVSITTSEYIEIDMAMKRKAIERCAPPAPARKVKATGTPAKTSSNGSKTSEPPKVMLSSLQSAILLPPLTPGSQTDHDKEAIAGVHIIPSST